MDVNTYLDTLFSYLTKDILGFDETNKDKAKSFWSHKFFFDVINSWW